MSSFDLNPQEHYSAAATPIIYARAEIEGVALELAENLKIVPGAGAKTRESLENALKNLGAEISCVDAESATDETFLGVEIFSQDHFAVRLSNSTTPERDTFDMAVALGHYLLHSASSTGTSPKQVENHSESVKIPRILPENPTDAQLQTEREGTWFACGLLMPEQLVRALHSEAQGSISTMADKLYMCERDVQMRATSLGLVSQGSDAKLVQEM